MGIYDDIIGLCWLAFFGVWVVLAFVGADRGRRAHSARGCAIRLVLFLAVFLALRYGKGTQLPSIVTTTGFAAAGSLLCVAGVAIAIWARVTLGRSWGMPMTVHERPDLVTSGPYRFVRHPIYTGVSAMMIGTAFVHPPAALLASVLVAYLLFSSYREEADMQRKFPDAYPEYKKRTNRLVPYLF